MSKRLLVLALAGLVVLAAVGCGGGTPPTPTPAPKSAAPVAAVKLNAHPTSLEGKTVVLRWNSKPNGDKLLTRVGELLTEQVKGVKVIKLWEQDKATAEISKNAEESAQLADKIAALKPDLLIASQAD